MAIDVDQRIALCKNVPFHQDKVNTAIIIVRKKPGRREGISTIPDNIILILLIITTIMIWNRKNTLSFLKLKFVILFFFNVYYSLY